MKTLTVLKYIENDNPNAHILATRSGCFYLCRKSQKNSTVLLLVGTVDSNRIHIKPFSFPGRCIEIKQNKNFFYFPQGNNLPYLPVNETDVMIVWNSTSFLVWILHSLKVYWNPLEDVKGLWKTLKTPNQTCRKYLTRSGWYGHFLYYFDMSHVLDLLCIFLTIYYFLMSFPVLPTHNFKISQERFQICSLLVYSPYWTAVKMTKLFRDITAIATWNTFRYKCVSFSE